MQFHNDTPWDLLMQIYVEGDIAYFIYYGTPDTRESAVMGPFIWGRSAPPPDRVEYTTDIAPGTTRQVGKAVAGLRSAWFRAVQMHTEGPEQVEGFYSRYEARPNYTQIGVEAAPAPSPDEQTAQAL